MSRNFFRNGLWILTIAVIVIGVVQGFSGHWVAFFLLWPGAPFGHAFLQAMGNLATYHIWAGFTIGALSVIILIFAFLAPTTIYVRIFAVLAFIIAALAVMGGYNYVTSAFEDRWSLGQMADAFVGVLAAYFIQLLFMYKTPHFPWERRKIAETPRTNNK